MFESIDELKKQMNKRDEASKKRTSSPKTVKKFKKPIDAIRAYCKQCCGGSNKEVERCVVTDCELWFYRCERHIQLTDEMEDIEID